MKYFFYSLILLALSAFGVHAEIYKMIDIATKDYQQQLFLEKYGIAPKEVIKSGERVSFLADGYALAALASDSIKYNVEIEDYSEYISLRNQNYFAKQKDIILSQDFKYGSMGGFFNLEELLAEYDSLVLKYPTLIFRDSLGKTYEGRTIFVYRFGLYSVASAQSLPEVLFTSLHHANEPAGAMALLYFVKHLFSSFDQNNPEAVFLLHNRLFSLVPVVNPDGYAYNCTQYPAGGGMWRKNRSAATDSTFGVDLNRNYGPMEFWDNAAGGSSKIPSASTYRGSAPFSEAETEAIKNLCEKSNFKIAVNYHTFGDLLIYPWGVLSKDTPDSNLFRKFSFYATSKNKYVYGVDWQTLNYITQGCADDWMYLENEKKAKILSFTPEVGNPNDSFWPRAERIPELCQDNLQMNYDMLWSSDYNFKVMNFDTESDELGESFLRIEIANIGRGMPPKTNLFTIHSLDSRITLDKTEHYITSLLGGESNIAEFKLNSTADFPNGSYVGFETNIIQSGVSRKDTFFVKLAKPEKLVLYDTSMTAWSSNLWGSLYDSTINKYVICDSPIGKSTNAVDNYLHYSHLIDLSNFQHAELVVRSKWFIEQQYDGGIIQVSSDAGGTWNSLNTSRMHLGLGKSSTKQEAGKHYLEGNIFDYINQTADLDAFCGKLIALRFGVLTDNSTSFDGWFISDVYINGYDKYTSINDEKTTPKPQKSIILQKGNDISFDSAVLKPSDFYLCDSRGRLIVSGKASFGQNSIETHNLPSGLYILLVQNGTQLEAFNYLITE